MTAFESPLRIRERTAFTGIDFGAVALAPEVRLLREDLNGHLRRLVAALPAPLAAEAQEILHGYGGGEFVGLFYTPVWSWLHWVGDAVAPDLAREAREAHALALFLHLWDDHLTDGQLAPDLLRLQLRSLAWERYTGLGRSLCRRLGLDPGLVDEHAARYLTSLHRPAPVADVEAYAERFRRQVAIWTLVPRLLGHAAGGAEGARALVAVVAEFAVAWRWVDDVQDIDEDVQAGKETAVWLELDSEGRRRWSATASDPAAWGALAEAVPLDRLLAFAADRVRAGARAARAQGWAGLAAELDQALRGLVCA